MELGFVMKSQLTLYVGNNCHLCNDAEQLLKPLLERNQLRLKKINIGNDPSLQGTFGLRIPVLILPSGEEHNWPFNWSRIEAILDKFQ